MGSEIVSHSSVGLLCGLHQFMSNTEGTALLFESEWMLKPSFGFPPSPTNPLPPTNPPPIDSIRDITGI